MPDQAGAPITVPLADEAETAALAGKLATAAVIGDIVALSGPLGCGKTTFARAFINARSARPEDVPSPTFTLVQAYVFADGAGGEIPVHHFDLYRIADVAETRELGFDDAFADGISLIEWPERLGAALSGNVLHVALAQGPDADARMATLTAAGSWPGRLQMVLETAPEASNG